jgi:hypothetical protein
MDGFFVQIKRDGKPINIELEKLSRDELAKWVRELDDVECRHWLLKLVRRVIMND